MIKRLKTTPKFASEAAERAFWEKNDSTGYLDWKKVQLTVLPNLKPSTQTISLRLPQHLLDSIKTAANARGVLRHTWASWHVQSGTRCRS
jgi:predicted DNA binding CopG/RHH family protein